MAKVYLETSFFSACVTTKQGVISRGWKASSRAWWAKHRTNHELFISEEVIAELSDPEYLQRDKALALASGLQELEFSSDVDQFAQMLVNQKVMPGPSNRGDAVHVALATVYQMDFILSWNVKHLANTNKRTHFAVTCLKAGLNPPTIVTPDMLE